MRRFVLAMLSLFLLLLVFGCASTRSTRKGKLAAESQLTATTEGNRRTEDRTTTNTTAITGSNEKQNIVIEFTKVEYYPEGQKPNRFAEQFQKADSAFNEDMRKALEMANGEPTRKTSETAEGQSDTSLRHNTDLFPAIEGLKKPPNVKSLTTGRIVINGDKQKTTETSVTTATETEVTETQKTTAEAETKETAQTEEEKYPKTNPFLWVLSGIGLAARPRSISRAIAAPPRHSGGHRPVFCAAALAGRLFVVHGSGTFDRSPTGKHPHTAGAERHLGGLPPQPGGAGPGAAAVGSQQ